MVYFSGSFFDRRNIHIEVQSDSVSAVAYVNNFGGMQCIKMDYALVKLLIFSVHVHLMKYI